MNDPEQHRRQYAYLWNALPSYIFQDKTGQTRNFEYEIAYVDRLVDPFRFYTLANEEAKIAMTLNRNDICIFYIIGNETLHRFLRGGGTLTELALTLNIDDETLTSMTNMWHEFSHPHTSREMIRRIEHVKNRFRADYEREKAEQDAFLQLEPVRFEPFAVEYVVRVYTFVREIGTILNFFDSIQVNTFAPLITTSRFYKILKGSDFTLERPVEDDTMYIFTTQGKVEIVQKENVYECSYQYKQNEDDQPYLQRICELLGIQVDQVTKTNDRFNGTSFFPFQTISNVIWRDFVMNNPHAQKHLAMDEHQMGIRIGKQSSRQIIRKSFFVFYFEGDIKVTFTIREDDLEQGVRLRIFNAISTDQAQSLLVILARLFALYNAVGTEIAKEYNKLLKEDTIEFIAPIYDAVASKKPQLKKLAPDMFLPNWTRKCGFLPDIISEEEARKAIASNVPVMQFPKPGDEVDGKSYHFICNHHDENIWPGLRKNPLENNSTFPILPCCYREDQRNRRSLFREYYESERKLKDFVPQVNPVQSIQYRFLLSDKFVGFEQTGKCPDMINQLFVLYTAAKPIRKGVHRSLRSALECVLVATRHNNFDQLASAERLTELDRQFQIIQGLGNTNPIYAQECWNKDFTQVVANDVYFDPRYLIRVLEHLYKCRIVLLSRDDFIQPNHIEGYLRWKSTKEYPIVVLFEHYGSEANEASYPQCEWILLETSDDQAMESVFTAYLASLETITRLPLPEETQFVQMIRHTIDKQYIDFYGKVYALRLRKSDKTTFTVFFDHDRFPVLANIPLAQKKEIAYTRQVTRYVFDNRYAAHTRTRPIVDQSQLQIYDKIRLQVELLFEHAKRIYAQRERLDQEDWSFINVSTPTAVPTEYRSKIVFNNDTNIIVPNEETKNRLIYSLKVYGIRYRALLEQYPTLNQIPFQYRTVHDFDSHPNELVLGSDSEIHWFSDFYQAKMLDGEIYKNPFVTLLAGKPCKCNPIDVVRQTSYRVHAPQFQKLFVVGHKPVREYLVLKNTKQVVQWYECDFFE
jgi:hypothetical protein